MKDLHTVVLNRVTGHRVASQIITVVVLLVMYRLKDRVLKKRSSNRSVTNRQGLSVTSNRSLDMNRRSRNKGNSPVMSNLDTSNLGSNHSQVTIRRRVAAGAEVVAVAAVAVVLMEVAVNEMISAAYLADFFNKTFLIQA